MKVLDWELSLCRDCMGVIIAVLNANLEDIL